jgi:hypothetical protein
VNSSGALWKIPSVIPFVIDMMNNVHSLSTEFVGKNDTSLFFLFCFNFFSTVISSVYIERIFSLIKSLKNLPTKFTWYFRLYLVMKLYHEFILGMI